MKIHKSELPRPPSHLSKRAAKFWNDLNEKYVFEPHDLERLRTCCECLDVIDTSRAAIDKAGMFVADRVGGVKQHPAVNVARDARQLLLRSLRELSIDVELPSEARLPRQGRRYGSA